MLVPCRSGGNERVVCGARALENHIKLSLLASLLAPLCVCACVERKKKLVKFCAASAGWRFCRSSCSAPSGHNIFHFGAPRHAEPWTFLGRHILALYLSHFSPLQGASSSLQWQKRFFMPSTSTSLSSWRVFILMQNCQKLNINSRLILYESRSRRPLHSINACPRHQYFSADIFNSAWLSKSKACSKAEWKW